MRRLSNGCLLLLLAATNLLAAEEERVTVFQRGENAYGCFRIPALLSTSNGTLLALADGRLKNCADIPNPLDLVLKRSTDSGKTWGPLQIIAGYGSDTNDHDVYPAYAVTNPVPRLCAGDAALLLDRTNGRVWTLYDNGAFLKGQSHNRVLKLEMRYSDDNGATWSAGIDVEKENPGLRPKGTDFMASPGNGIQLESGPHAGRLIFAAYVWAKPFYSTVIYSDDHGRTWKRGGISAEGGGETQIAETSGGGLLATIRNNTFPETGVRFFNRSADGGETWGTPYFKTVEQPEVPDPKCQASLLRVAGGTNVAWLLSNASHPSARSNLTVRISYDEGRTWRVSKVIYPGSAAYSALTALAPHEFGLLWEVDGYNRIVFAPFSVPHTAQARE